MFYSFDLERKKKRAKVDDALSNHSSPQSGTPLLSLSFFRKILSLRCRNSTGAYVEQVASLIAEASDFHLFVYEGLRR